MARRELQAVSGSRTLGGGVDPPLLAAHRLRLTTPLPGTQPMVASSFSHSLFSFLETPPSCSSA